CHLLTGATSISVRCSHMVLYTQEWLRSAEVAGGSALTIGSMEGTSSPDSATIRCSTFTQLLDALNGVGSNRAAQGVRNGTAAQPTGLRSRCAAGRPNPVLHGVLHVGLFAWVLGADVGFA